MLDHINSSPTFCKRQGICSVMLMQGARCLLKVLFVKLEKRQALEDGRNLNFSAFVFFIEIQNIDDIYDIPVFNNENKLFTLTFICVEMNFS